MQVTKSQQSKKVGYRDLLNEKNYILQTLATILSRFGAGIDTIAFSSALLSKENRITDS